MYKEYKQEEHWDGHYRKKDNVVLNYDGWLDKYIDIFPQNAKIVDLGCGSGSDTDFLLKKGFSVCSTDFSEEALKVLKSLVPQAKALKVDLTEKLPFEDNEFDVVVADLSLHYFEWVLTKQIETEIKRILKNEGIIIARFNSDKDYGFGADNGKILEPGLRLVHGRTKRFFSEKDIDDLFTNWKIICKCENITERYLKAKAYWEFAAYNRK